MTKLIFTLMMLYRGDLICQLFGPQQTQIQSLKRRVDLERYQGKWYEIVRLPNFFQSNDDKCVTATYTLKEDYVEVFN